LALAVLGASVALAAGQNKAMDSKVTAQEIAEALKQPTCVIKMDHTIDVRDLPHDLPRFPDWMKGLRDDLPISMVSIPATHDAGTALGRTGGTWCQSLTIPAQLELGIRGLDIRLCLVGNEFHIYHGDEYQKVTFDQVMSTLRSFLHAHPHEFFVMRVKEEHPPQHPTTSFLAAFEEIFRSKRYGSLFYHATSRTEIPTVAQMRGKILVMDNYGKMPDVIDYANPTMTIQDDYDTSDMEHKYTEIVANFEGALSNTDASKWFMNYTSSYTTQVSQLANAKAINPRVVEYLRGKHGHLGLVLMNFPGPGMIRQILESN